MKPHYKRSLALRLLLGFGLVIALMLAITVVAIDRLNFLHEKIDYVVGEASARAGHAQAMLNASDETVIALYGFALVVDTEDAKAQRRQFDVAVQKYQSSRTALERKLGEESGNALKLVDTAANATLAMSANLLEAISQGSSPLTTLESLNPQGAVAPWRRAIVQLADREAENSREAAMTATEAHSEARTALIAFATAAFVAGTVASWLILRSITRPLKTAIWHAKAIATGDLTGEIAMEAEDETGELLKAIGHMQEQLRNLVLSIQTGTQGIEQASAEIAAGNHDLSIRTELSAAEIQQTTTLMTDLADTLVNSSEEAKQASNLTDQAAQTARRGCEQMMAMVRRMDEVQRSAERVGEITNVIQLIASQTTILALNAAVEAARAGKQGLGFAIVASEVRSLASRTAEASREIGTLIATCVNDVRSGTDSVKLTEQAMSDLAQEILRASVLVQRISSSSQKQSEEARQARMVLCNLDNSTQQNAALVEQTAAAAQALKNQAVHLDTTVNTFRA